MGASMAPEFGPETLVVRQAHHEGLGTFHTHYVIPVKTGIQCTASAVRRSLFCGHDCPLLDSRFHGNDVVGVAGEG